MNGALIKISPDGIVEVVNFTSTGCNSVDDKIFKKKLESSDFNIFYIADTDLHEAKFVMLTSTDNEGDINLFSTFLEEDLFARPPVYGNVLIAVYQYDTETIRGMRLNEVFEIKEIINTTLSKVMQFRKNARKLKGLETKVPGAVGRLSEDFHRSEIGVS